ncbi:MAG TPA: hypothetical protein VFU11_05700 [Solirubrobacterales bacterium]|nr:hypothetical protein [Solirubrobacterales bacterium]
MEEAEAKSAELANVLLIVGIALAVAIPLFEVVYGTVTGSAAPFGWRLMALPGGVITLAKMLSLKGKGGGPPGGVPA